MLAAVISNQFPRVCPLQGVGDGEAAELDCPAPLGGNCVPIAVAQLELCRRRDAATTQSALPQADESRESSEIVQPWGV